ncbi:MAG TPA: hypothetical protein EYN89_06685 [Flavobacteriales bacterium]|nr:hypothetical protein [Flavobacteriales bacterium]
MASTFKTFLANDITTTKTLLHEAIPITGTIVSGTYKGPIDSNIKTFSHGMFESVYDYPYLSSSANHIFDITAGWYSGSLWQEVPLHAAIVQDSKKINIYNQFAQVLVPYDVSGNIQQFDQDGDTAAGGTKMDSCFFITFSRLLTKDEVKKGNFRFSMYVNSTGSTNGTVDPEGRLTPVTLGDYGAATSFKVNSPTGEYGLIFSQSADSSDPTKAFGHIYYQAGILVLTSSIFREDLVIGGYIDTPANSITGSREKAFQSGTIDQLANALRYAIDDIDFNNTTELNSTMYFCRANTNEYNYSANPTYLSDSKIVVKGDNAFAEPVSYITTVGLYSADNELLATAKVSEPLKKAVSNEVTLRVRLDY